MIKLHVWQPGILYCFEVAVAFIVISIHFPHGCRLIYQALCDISLSQIVYHSSKVVVHGSVQVSILNLQSLLSVSVPAAIINGNKITIWPAELQTNWNPDYTNYDKVSNVRIIFNFWSHMEYHVLFFANEFFCNIYFIIRGSVNLKNILIFKKFINVENGSYAALIWQK